MMILDENIPESQKHLLKGWRIRTHQIGCGFEKTGIKDEAIIPLLHRLKNAVFFTRDLGEARGQIFILEFKT
jgi:hypothetical protein